MWHVARIGVIADTHCPEFLDDLPAGVFERLRGVDLILHAGDVGGSGGEETLRRLATIAPVEAVHGDHDQCLEGLPTRRELSVEGHRIGIVHGNRSHLVEEPLTFLSTMSLSKVRVQPGHRRWLRGQFPECDVIVYGHTHIASAVREGAVLFLNPGAVYQVRRPEMLRRMARGPGWFEWTWLQVTRHRLDRPFSTVGILELGKGTTRVTIHEIGPGLAPGRSW